MRDEENQGAPQESKRRPSVTVGRAVGTFYLLALALPAVVLVLLRISGHSVAPSGVIDLVGLGFVYSSGLAVLCFPGLAAAVMVSRLPRTQRTSEFVGATAALCLCGLSAAGAISFFAGMNLKN